MQNQPVRALDAVAKALDAKHFKDAVHLFVQSMDHGLAARQKELLPLLVAQFGMARTTSLVGAFARHPCMVCKRGLLLCEECKGKGVFDDEKICDQCVGLGAANCGFCAGSGWITYNYVPPGIRVPVVSARLKFASAEAAKALKETLPSADDEPLGRTELARRLLELNRLMGACDNALEVTRHPPESSQGAASTLKAIRETSLRTASRLERRIRQILVLLVRDAMARAERTTSHETRDLEKRRARFYHTLAKSSDFKRTSLRHVYLHREKAARSGKQAEPSSDE